MATTAKKSTNTIYRVRKDELPLSCPREDAELWSMHPKVFLPIEKTGEAVCPYCGAQYMLQD
jgi:uncharacterized Zn-finger protein